ncbi:amylovoran biosynthesis protein AmsF|nr:amylovoran biosynthesis protein AmsF [Candidatus Pantoea persica]
MKRREVLQTAASSIVAALSVSAFSSYAANSSGVTMKPVEPSALPKDDVPILTPENLLLCRRSSGTPLRTSCGLVKRAATLARRNQIPVFLRDASGKLS